jgi:hypothetical protein
VQRPYPSGHEAARLEAAGPAAQDPQEEVLIADARAGLTPSDMVERKLRQLLRGAAVAGSHLRMELSRGRGLGQGQAPAPEYPPPC